MKKRRIKYRKGLIMLLTFSSLFLLSPERSQQVEAATILKGSTQRAENGSNFWKTTNLREWLNSNSATVKYTNNAPNTANLGNNAFDKEKGFLANFTAVEQNGIAVTKHRVQVQTNDAAALNLPGTASPNHNTPIVHPSLAYSAPKLLDDYLNYHHQMVNDKVYLISTYEAYLYIQKRGFSLGKDPTNALKQKTGLATIGNWHVSGGEGHSGIESTYLLSENQSFSLKGKPKLPAGVVPAIHLKPTFTLSNGTQAKNLSIGDVVTFGKFLNEPIQWRVINKTNNYPMLISEKVIDYKPIDAPGDLAYADSISANFDSHEVDVSNYPESAKANNDTTMPKLTIVNGKELNVRKNNGFQLQLNASDNVGIDSVILPNGSVVKGSIFTYTVSKNDEYTFIVKDVSGNYQYFVLPVGNINLPYTMQTTVNPTDWTSGNVSVKVNATNEGVGEKRSVLDLDQRDSYLNQWSDYSTYIGKRIRISGNVEYVSAAKPLGNIVAKAGYRYTYLTYSNGNYNKGNTWVGGWEIKLSDLKAKGKQQFNFIATVPNDYFSGIQPWLNLSNSHADSGQFKVKWTNLNYELIDDNDFSIQKIILPNGKTISGSSYTDTLTEYGTYKYQVVDNRDMTLSQNITAKIDKTAPTLAQTSSHASPTNASSQVIKVKATDNTNGSGVIKVRLPNGTFVTDTNELKNDISYTASENGTYQFIAYDKVGHSKSLDVVVNNFDHTAPSGSITGNPTAWTKNNVTLTLNPSDSGGSGYYRTKLPDGTYSTSAKPTYSVSSNGTYTFTVYDHAGNSKTISAVVNRIDKTVPSLDLTKSTSSWTNGNITLNATSSDTQSGLNYITLPSATKVYSSPASQSISSNGTYTFKAIDHAGNETSKAIVVTNIDKTAPTGSISGNPSNWTANDVTLTVNTSDSGGSGYYRTKLPNGTYSTSAKPTYTVSGNGTYTFTIYDNAGNATNVSQTVSKIDKAKPTLALSQTPTSWTNQNVLIQATSSDSASGIRNVELLQNYVGKNLMKNATKEVTNATREFIQWGDMSPIFDEYGVGAYTISFDLKSTQNGTVQVYAQNGSDTEYNIGYSPIQGTTSYKRYSVTVNVTKANANLTQSMLAFYGVYGTGIKSSIKNVKIEKGSSVTPFSLHPSETTTGGNVSFEVTENGTYTVISTDNVGNKEQKSITINNIDKSAPSGSISGNPTAWTNQNVTLTLSPSDTGGSGYYRTKLPDGTLSTNTKPTYTVSSNGTYTFTVYDHAGNSKEVSINVSKIDKTLPGGTVSGNPTSWTNQNVTLTLSPIDGGGSGYYRTKLPDGTYTNLAKPTYTVTSNGTYTFVVYDNAGNSNNVSINVTKIDKTLPVLGRTEIKNVTQDSFDVYVYDVSDAGGSQINRVQFPTWTNANVQDDLLSSWMTDSKATGENLGNGTWRFTVERSAHNGEFGDYTIHVYAFDNAGNRRSVATSHHLRDQVKPTISVTGNPTTWGNGDITLTVNGYDAHTGVKSITLPDGTVVTKNGGKGQTVTHTYRITQNGSYTFKVTDMYDNVATQTVTVNKIDKANPALTVTNNPTNWTNQDVTLVVTGSDGASGVSHIILPNGVLSNQSKVNYAVKENGKYKFTVYDEAGNKTEKTETVNRIDKIIPSQSTIEIEVN